MKKFFLFFAAALFCANITAQQLSESFENEQFPPEGWTTIADHSYPSFSSWNRYVKQEGSTMTIADGVACAYVNPMEGASNYLITPQLRPQAGEKLIFYARVNEYAKGGELQILVSVNGNSTTEFTETLGALPTSSTAADPRLFKEWQAYQLPLDEYVGQRIFIAFHHYDKSSASKIYLDNIYGVTLAGSSSCESPYNVKVTKVTDTEASIAWEGDAAQYEYVLMPAGQAPAWANAVKTAEKSVVLSDLYEDTSYEFYVRSYCSETEQSLAPHVSFKTACELQTVPWIETFTRDATGDIAPYCWIISSETPRVWVVADKTTDEEYDEEQVIYGQAHLGVSGGGPNTAQVFALPAFDARLDTLEIAFKYHTQVVDDERYGSLELGYMNNPSDAATFVALDTFPQTLTDSNVVFPLNAVPAEAQYIAFRFAGGTTSDMGSLSMDNFIVAAIGHTQDIDPADEEVPDAGIWRLTYCEASFTWYSYVDDAFAIALFDAESQKMVSGITPTTSECERFANQDQANGLFDGFSEYDDYENHYYCSTRWILNADDETGGMKKGEAWADDVINVGTTVTPVLGLKPGKYQVQVYSLDASTYNVGSLLATIPFELVSIEISNLQVNVAEDKKTATFTWDTPALSTGERIYASIRSGETVVFDNFDDTHKKAVSPLTVDVEEGRSYDARFQIIDKDYTPLGAEVTINFTVGVNEYEPQDPHAEVFGGDNVTFTWSATTQADRYLITLFADGDFYTTLTVNGFAKTTTMPVDATWSWTVQAFNQGSNENYFEASNPIPGNSFITKAADIPEDAIVMNVWGMEAAYLDQFEDQFPKGMYAWMVMFATGEEGDGNGGYPQPWFLIYTTKEDAISGVYNVARANIDLESTYINTNGTQAGCIMATDGELRLQFDGFDEEYFAKGYAYGYYTGSFRIVAEDGNTYVGKFMEQFCNSYNYSTYGSIRDHHGMWEEDPENPWQAIDNVIATGENGKKFIVNGQLFILREGRIYNAQGALVK